MPVLLELLLQLLRLAMTDLDRVDSIISLLQLDGTVTNILAYMHHETGDSGTTGIYDIPSISFHAFRKSSGSENATNPYFAWIRVNAS